MNRLEKWAYIAKNSRDAIEDFNDLLDDKAIVWADNEMKNYKRAMMILVNASDDWAAGLQDEDEAFVRTMINRATST